MLYLTIFDYMMIVELLLPIAIVTIFLILIFWCPCRDTPTVRSVRISRPPVVVQPAPVVMQPTPVVMQPAPVVMQPAPVIMQPTPIIIPPAPIIIPPAPLPTYVNRSYLPPLMPIAPITPITHVTETRTTIPTQNMLPNQYTSFTQSITKRR